MSQKKKQPRVSPKAKKNFIIFVAIAAAVFALLIWSLFGGGSSGSKKQEAASADLKNAGTAKLEKAEVDRTETMSTIQDKGYLNQLRKAEKKKREQAENTPDDSYMSDVSMYQWQEVPEGGSSNEGQQTSYQPGAGNNSYSQTAGQASRETSKSNGRPNYQALAVKAKAEQESSGATMQGQPENRSTAGPNGQSNDSNRRASRLTLEQRRALVNNKVNALEKLIKNQFAVAPSSVTNDHTENENDAQQTDQRQQAVLPQTASHNSSNNVASEEAAVQPGVLPGDRFVGYTTTAINTDTTNWVEVEISQGPLKGAIVGLVPERVEGEVVLSAKNITHERNTSDFKAIALNPDVNLEPAFSTETNMRYLARFGAATASAVLNTTSNLISQQQSSTVNQDGFATQSVDYSKEEIAIAAGAAGGAEVSRMISEEASKIEPQVKVKANHRVVLAVTSPQAISWMPEPYVIKKEQ